MSGEVLLHCGLGTGETPESKSFLSNVLRESGSRIAKGASALSVSWFAVSALERSGLFNAGLGAIAQEDGIVRRDVGTMNGEDLKSLGLLSLVGTPCPMDLLTRLYGHTRHVLVSGLMAEGWGVRHGLSDRSALEPPSEKAIALWDEKTGTPAPGTVGAVIRDLSGHVAATTSTGGMGEMLPGRIGDSSIPGAGYYADDDLGAISMTGHGEGILSMALGIRLLETHHSADNAEKARQHCQALLGRLAQRTPYKAGAILVSRKNGPLIIHLGPRMLAGIAKAGETALVRENWQDLSNLP